MPAPVLSVQHVLAWPCADIDGLPDPGAPFEDGRIVFPPTLTRRRLAIAIDTEGALQIGEGGETGTVGRHLRCVDAPILTTASGARLIAPILTEDGTDNTGLLVSPSPPPPGATYGLSGRAAVPDAIARLPTLCFFRGTRISMGNGAKTPIEKLRPGARVITQDGGVRTVLWVGGHMASVTPLTISKGVLGNARALTLTPDHRLFPRPGPDHAVKARHLVDEHQVTTAPRRNIALVQLLLDEHHPILAEGIAAESRLVPSLPPRPLPAALLNGLGTARCDGSDPCTCTGGAPCATELLRDPDAFQTIRRIAAHGTDPSRRP